LFVLGKIVSCEIDHFFAFQEQLSREISC
jgi:hypothetical protein